MGGTRYHAEEHDYPAAEYCLKLLFDDKTVASILESQKRNPKPDTHEKFHRLSLKVAAGFATGPDRRPPRRATFHLPIEFI